MNRLPMQFYKNLWSFSTASAKFGTSSIFFDRTSNNRQGKIISKLFGKRVSGSKKRWFDSPGQMSQAAISFPLNSIKSYQGTNRRMTVLNKLFMTHITDLLATGEASPKIIGKGLQVTRVKVTQNFQLCNVYWIGKGDAAEDELEDELQKCAGLLRHELSQLRLMGEIPRIYFVKDKTFKNLAQVEMALKTCDFGENHKQIDPGCQIKSDLYFNGSSIKSEETDTDNDAGETPPEMRHDVFGLDRREIMLKIITKMRKSEQAWQQYERGDQPTKGVTILEKFDRSNEKITISEQYELNNLLTNMSEQKRMRNRRFQRADDGINHRGCDDDSDPLDDGDYIEEEYDQTK